jgi:septal ring factor EnvC (AmiA/AmiB activator)
VQETEQHLAAARNEIANNQQAMVARSQELADVGKRLEAARQQESQAREELARIA